MSHGPDYRNSERKRQNDLSKRWARRDGQPWTADEEQFLIEEWIDVHPQHRDEVTVSQCLERTIESCRVRCEIIRKKYGWNVYEITTTTTTTTERYIGSKDEPDDCWWSPEYYNK